MKTLQERAAEQISKSYKTNQFQPLDIANKLLWQCNNSLEKGAITEDEYTLAVERLDKSLQNDLEKAHKYFKREGTPGNYKYYYTEQEYKEAKGEKKKAPTQIPDRIQHQNLKDRVKKYPSKKKSTKNNKQAEVAKEKQAEALKKEEKPKHDFSKVDNTAKNNAERENKSENKEIKKSLDDNLNILKGEYTDIGEKLFKPFLDVIKEALKDKKDLEKSDIYYSFTSGNDKMIFNKKGSEIKQKVNQKLEKLNEDKQVVLSKITSLKEKLEKYNAEFVNNIEYDYDTAKWDSNQSDEVKDCVSSYNSLIYQCVNLKKDIKTLNILLENLDDNKSYKLTTSQLTSLEKSEKLDIEKASKAQQEKIGKVMSEFKSGELKSSSGDKVTNKDQAIAIAMSEAGLSKAMSENDFKNIFNIQEDNKENVKKALETLGSLTND